MNKGLAVGKTMACAGDIQVIGLNEAETLWE